MLRNLFLFRRQQSGDYNPSAGVWVEILGNLFLRPRILCCYFCHEAQIRYHYVSFPTLVFLKAMPPMLVVAPGGTASDVVTHLGHREGPLRAGRLTGYVR